MARAGVRVDVRTTDGAVENLQLLNGPQSGIQIAFMQGGIANGERAPDLLSLGRIDYQVFWLFYPARESFSDLTQLKGTHRFGARGQRYAHRVRKDLKSRRHHLGEYGAAQPHAAKGGRCAE